jgi:NitT/TauT family transport system substrate-binding protein
MRTIFVVAFILLAGCQPVQPPVNLAGNTWLGYQPLYLALAERDCADCILELGDNQQLQVTMLPSTTQVLRLLSTGQLDAAMLTLDEALTFQSETGIDICIASVLSYSNGADAVLVLPDFDPAKPFQIGYEETALGGYMLRRTLELKGWATKQFTARTLVPRRHVQALLDGEIDVVITYEPYVSQLRNAGAVTQLDSRQLPGEIIDILVVRRQVWQQRQQLFTLLLDDIWPKGLARLRQPDAAALALLSRNTELSLEQLQQALAGMVFPDKELKYQQLAAKLSSLIDSMNQYLLQTAHISQAAQLEVCR